jgi:hypothetical protein
MPSQLVLAVVRDVQTLMGGGSNRIDCAYFYVI